MSLQDLEDLLNARLPTIVQTLKQDFATKNDIRLLANAVDSLNRTLRDISLHRTGSATPTQRSLVVRDADASITANKFYGNNVEPRPTSSSLQIGSTAQSIDIGSGSVTSAINVGTGNTTPAIITIGSVNDTVVIPGTLDYPSGLVNSGGGGGNTGSSGTSVPFGAVITLNENGAAASAAGSGVQVKENATVTASVVVNPSRSGWRFKAPGNASVVDIVPNSGSNFSITQGSHNPITLHGTSNGLTLNTQVLGLELASRTNSGALSSAHYTLLSDASESSTSDTLAKRDSTGALNATILNATHVHASSDSSFKAISVHSDPITSSSECVTIKNSSTNSPRWKIRTLGMESGSNNGGNNIAISRCSDAGVILDDPFVVERDTGYVVVNRLKVNDELQGLPTPVNFSGALAGEVTGTQSSTILASKIISSVHIKDNAGIENQMLNIINTPGMVTNAATSANTTSTTDTIALRDGSGNCEFNKTFVQAVLSKSEVLDVGVTTDSSYSKTINIGTGSNTTTINVGSTNDTITMNATTLNLATSDGVTAINVGSTNDIITMNAATLNFAVGSEVSVINVGSPNDTITMNAATLNLATTNDVTAINVGSMNDIITMNAATLNFATGSDVSTINVGSPNDTITMNAATVNLATTNDVTAINVGSANDIITMNAATLNFATGSDVSAINVGSTNDTVTVNAATLNIATNNDATTINVGSVNDVITMNASTLNLATNSDVSVINVGSPNDSMTLNATTLNIAASNDTSTINIGSVNDTITLKANTLNLASSSDPTNINMGSANDNIAINASVLLLATDNNSSAVSVGSGNSQVTVNASLLNLATNESGEGNFVTVGTRDTVVSLNASLLNLASNVEESTVYIGNVSDVVVLNGAYINVATTDDESVINIGSVNDTISLKASTLNLAASTDVSTINLGSPNDTVNLKALNANITATNTNIYGNMTCQNQATFNTMVTANISGTAAGIRNNLGGVVSGTYDALQYTAGSISDTAISNTANISPTKLATITTAGKVANSATTANESGIANTIALRKVDGSLEATKFYGTLNGPVDAASYPGKLSSIVTTAGTSASGSVHLNLSTNAGTDSRALISLIDDAGTGITDSGSNFSVARVSDSGANLGAYLVGERKTGIVTFPKTITATNGVKGTLYGPVESTNSRCFINSLASYAAISNTHWTLFGSDNANFRASIGLTNTETGSNGGGDFGIWRYSDGGAVIAPYILGTRSSGLISIPGGVTTTSLAMTNTVLGSLSVYSGANNVSTSIRIGRSGMECEIGVVGTAGHIVTTSAVGEIAINAANNLLFGFNGGYKCRVNSTGFAVNGTLAVTGNMTVSTTSTFTGKITTTAGIQSNAPITITTSTFPALSIISGAAANNTSLGLGRVATEGEIAIAATDNSFLTSANAGDVAIRCSAAARKVVIGAGTVGVMSVAADYVKVLGPSVLSSPVIINDCRAFTTHTLTASTPTSGSELGLKLCFSALPSTAVTSTQVTAFQLQCDNLGSAPINATIDIIGTGATVYFFRKVLLLCNSSASPNFYEISKIPSSGPITIEPILTYTVSGSNITILCKLNVSQTTAGLLDHVCGEVTFPYLRTTTKFTVLRNGGSE